MLVVMVMVLGVVASGGAVGVDAAFVLRVLYIPTFSPGIACEQAS